MLAAIVVVAANYTFTAIQSITENLTTITPSPVSQASSEALSIITPSPVSRANSETISTITPSPVSRPIVELLHPVNPELRVSVGVTETLVTVDLLRLRFTYNGTLCTDKLNGYAYIVDSSTGEVVGSHYIPSSDEYIIALEIGRVYRIVLPSSGSCNTGSCTVRHHKTYVDGQETANTTITITFYSSMIINVVYNIIPTIPYSPALAVAPSGSIQVGGCPDSQDKTCYWFGDTIALSMSCTLIGEVRIDIYEFSHNETIVLMYNNNLLLELRPRITRSYRVISIKIMAPCRLYLVSLSVACRVLHMDVEMKAEPQIKVPAPTITVPAVELAAPEIASPPGLIMFGSLIGLFLFMSKKTRWPHALFVVSVVLAVGGMVVFQSPSLFVIGILMALVSIVIDRYV